MINPSEVGKSGEMVRLRTLESIWIQGKLRMWGRWSYIGGGIGGAVIGAFGNVGAIAIGPSGVALIPLIANNQWLAYVLGLLAAYAGGFVATLFFGIPKDMQTTK